LISARGADETSLTGDGMIGSWHYMAPERFRAREADARADIYALACVLYECLTGRRPFPGDSLESQYAAHKEDPPPKPSATRPKVPAQFDAVIANGMAKHPDNRYATTVELAGAARDASTVPIQRPTPPPAPEVPPPPAPAPVLDSELVLAALRKSNVYLGNDGAGDINQQRRAEAKRKLERQLERRAKQARTSRILLIVGGSIVAVAVIAAVVITVINSSKNEGSITATTTTVSSSAETMTTTASSSVATTTAVPQTGLVPPLPPFKSSANLGANCQYPASADPAAKPVKAPFTGKIPTNPAQVSASVATNRGNIGLILANNESPCTVNNFASLIGQRYFDNTKCHRLTTSPTLSVLQCGDPKGDGTGGPGYQFANEYPIDQYAPNDPKLQEPVVYPRGTLAMANAGPNTNGSQFFMVYKDSQLPPQYTVFGTIEADGLATLDKIAQAGVAGGGEDGAPVSEVTIKSLLLD
jgi:peptidyl-prolyl cis-trans isomerase B (cyclophilin B)